MGANDDNCVHLQRESFLSEVANPTKTRCISISFNVSIILRINIDKLSKGFRVRRPLTMIPGRRPAAGINFIRG